MTSILCTNVFLSTELNAMQAYIWFFFIDFMYSMYDRFTACSCPAQTCNEPTDEIRSFLIGVTMTLPAIRQISKTPIRPRPQFLSRGIKNAKNA